MTDHAAQLCDAVLKNQHNFGIYWVTTRADGKPLPWNRMTEFLAANINAILLKLYSWVHAAHVMSKSPPFGNFKSVHTLSTEQFHTTKKKKQHKKYLVSSKAAVAENQFLWTN